MWRLRASRCHLSVMRIEAVQHYHAPSAGFGRLCGLCFLTASARNPLLTRQENPRLGTIPIHLRGQVIQRIELRLAAQEVVEGDFDFLVIEIAVEIEEERLEQFLGGIE